MFKPSNPKPFENFKGGGKAMKPKLLGHLEKNLGISNPSANGFCSVVPSVIMNIFLIVGYCLFSGYLGSFSF